MGDTVITLLCLSLLLGGWTAQAHRRDNDEDIEIRPGLRPGCYREPLSQRCGGVVVFRWYYDKYSDSCKVFPFRGCRDNGNNFITRNECINICIKSSVNKRKRRRYRKPHGKSASVSNYRYAPERIQEDRSYDNSAARDDIYNSRAGDYMANERPGQYDNYDRFERQDSLQARQNTVPNGRHHPSNTNPYQEVPRLQYDNQPQISPPRQQPQDMYRDTHRDTHRDTLRDSLRDSQRDTHRDYTGTGRPGQDEGPPHGIHPQDSPDSYIPTPDRSYQSERRQNSENRDYVPERRKDFYSPPPHERALSSDSDNNYHDDVPYDNDNRQYSYEDAKRTSRSSHKQPYWEPAYIYQEPYKQRSAYARYESDHPFYEDKEVERPRYFRPYENRENMMAYPPSPPNQPRKNPQMRDEYYPEPRYNPQRQQPAMTYPQPPPRDSMMRSPPGYEDRYDKDERYLPDDNRYANDNRYPPEDRYEEDNRYNQDHMMPSPRDIYPGDFPHGPDRKYRVSELDPVNLYQDQLSVVEKDSQAAKRKSSYYQYEVPEHSPNGPDDEYFYGKHKKRPKDIPPNRYIFGEGPVHPQEVPKEIQDFDPSTNTEEVYPVTEEYNSPQDSSEKEQPFVNEEGYAPKPHHGAFPGIPTDPALRRFRLRSGWVIEIIEGGFRAIKDETEINGWKHVYARIYREAPDGSAGRSIWMFQSEYESPKETEEDRAPPPEYLQHVGKQQSRRKRAVFTNHLHHPPLPLTTRPPWLLSPILSSLYASGPPPPPPNHWSRHDELDEMYGEPNVKHLHDGDIPFVNNLHNDEMPAGEQKPPPHQLPHTPINGRSVYKRNFNGGNGRPMMNQAQFGPPMFRQQFSPPHHLHAPRGHHLQEQQPIMQQRQQQKETDETPSAPVRKQDEFMSDSDIFDQLPDKPEETKPKEDDEDQVKEQSEVSSQHAEAPEAQPQTGEFMSDSDIFDGLPTIPKDGPKDKEAEEQEIDSEKNDATQGANKEYDFNDGDLDDGGFYTDPENTPMCLQFPETGSCRAYIRRWYYDPRKGDCFTFIYGGCDGNKNSFATKEDCMKACSVPSTEEVPQEPSEEEEQKPEPKSHSYLGLRRHKPADIAPTENFQPEPHEDIDQFDKDQSESKPESESSETSESSDDEEDLSRENRLPVINHFYTYHNYGPYRSRHESFHGRSYRGNNLNRPEESESTEESDEEPDQPDHEHKKIMPNPFPSPLKFFFKILKKIRPRNSLAIMRPRSDDKPVVQSFHRKTNNGGISLIKFMFTKKPVNKPLTPMRPPAPINPLFNSRPFPEPRQGLRIFPHPPPRDEAFPVKQAFPSDFLDVRPPPLPHISSNPKEQLLIERFLASPPRKTSFPMFPLMPFMMPHEKKPAPVTPAAPAPPSHGEHNFACSQPREEGNCAPRIGMPKWYYDQERGICDIFFYNGCGGTLNRFDTFEQCRDICMVRSPAPPVDMVPKPPKADTAEKAEEKAEIKEVVKEELKKEEKKEEEKKEEEKKEEEKKTEEKKEETNVESKQDSPAPVMHTFEFSHMHMDSRMEFILVIVIMILGGTALIVLVAITAFYMYKKHKLASRGAKETSIEKVIQAHAYPEVHKISVIELPGSQVAGVHALKSI